MDEAQEIRESINNFSNIMFSKMERNIDDKEGWDDIEILYALEQIKEETEELEKALISQDAKSAKLECADIANFCMMLWKQLEERT